ncbi:MAG: chitobiase/beta-hexosaminidase C-terminal domain-containing protein [Lachnospiraceae bacterium]|nr:chitobiase/beta-hexosaminidase C-terminal domain-containing protein [Lachnospiraceae bacterium]
MRKKDDIGFKLQKRIKLFGMALAMPVLMLMAGLQADAAKKETPLVNLAKGKTTITSSSNQSVTNPEYLTDGDKYYLEHNSTGNKNGNSWEAYNEKGAVVQGGYIWLQLDLGESYPIEVINLKRQNYRGATTASDNTLSGTKITYQKTAVVIANEPDFSDGYVVYYQDGADLPGGLQKPEASQTYVEPMGGQWFYMDYTKNKGLGATDLGTTKTARYIRVYTHDTEASSVKFMELGVYGYKNEEDIQKTTGKRRIINEENPMILATAYSDDVYAIGQTTEPTLQGYNTVSGRCLATPEDLREYSTLLLHTNNLRQFSPEHIGQANVQAFYEHGLQITYENNTPAFLLGISASAVPGGAHWYPIRYMDLGWLDLMYRMYPNMQGTLNTENYWSGAAGAVARNSAAQLEIAHRFGGYFIWADQDHGGYVEGAFTNATWKEALSKYGQSCFMLYKNTGGGSDDMETTSYHQGHWLAGYTGGWGMLSDTWFWDSKNYSKLWQTGGGYSNWQKLCGVPEALMGAQMLSTYLGGGVIYTFEFPEIVYGVKNTNSPTYTHVIAPLFRYFIENPAPTRAEVLQETKVMLHGHLGSKDIYSGTAGTQTGINVYETGRYGLIPTILPLETREDAAARLAQVAEEAGLTTVPSLMDSANSILNGQSRIKYFQQLYAKEYEGDAFADQLDGSWYVYNNKINQNVNQTATLPLEGGEGARIKATLEPHTYFILKEAEDGTSVDMTLNNYRVNKDVNVFDNPNGWSWEGTFAPGQGTISGKLSVYKFMGELNVVNATGDKKSPEDNTLRTTTFELAKLAKVPTVTIVEGQQPDTDGKEQYSEPVVNFDQSTGTATITITCNGWVNLKITDLEYAADDEYELDLSDPVTEGVKENLALNKSVTHSAATSTTGRNGQGVDGTINTGNYADPGGNSGGAHWMQVDLAGLHEVEEVKLYRYWDDSRQYNDTVILLSPDSDFPADNTLVLWNANRDASRTWPGTINGQTGTTHTLPKGEQQNYPETAQGKSIKVYDDHVKWLDGDTTRQKPEANGRFQARYVRVYMNGSGANSSNHIIELQVFGETGQVVLTDTEAPTVPSQLKQVSVSETGAVISFRPSVDNMGMKHYEVTYKKAGEETGTTVQVEEASVTLTGLESDSQYEITVVAVDNFDNKSAASEALTIQTAADTVVVPLTVTASVEEGSYTEEQQVTLTPSEEGGAIYYTLDGSDPLDAEGNPTANAVEYTAAVTISKSATLKAAMKKEDRVSEVFSWSYEITTQTPEEPDQPDNPSAEPLKLTTNVKAGSYTEAQKVALTPSEAGGEIYYTLDGSNPLDTKGNPTANAVKYTAAVTVDKSVTLKAMMKKGDRVSEVFSWKYQVTSPTPSTPTEPKFPFTDVPVIAKHWKYEAVKYVWLNNVMNGISGTTLFDPDSPLTRAMFATVLYRMADSPVIAFENKFTDVADGKYYSKAIIWANKQGIVSGFTDGSYGVSVNITREQIAKMLFEFAANRKFNTQGKASLESFTDQKSVSHWAVDYMCWAVDAGMISGKPNGDGTFRLDPKGEATRAECAKMLQMFMEKYF